MLAGIDHAQQPPQFFFGIPTFAPHSCRHRAPPTRGGVNSKAVAQFPRSGRPLANVTSGTHHLPHITLEWSVASF